MPTKVRNIISRLDFLAPKFEFTNFNIITSSIAMNNFLKGVYFCFFMSQKHCLPIKTEYTDK